MTTSDASHMFGLLPSRSASPEKDKALPFTGHSPRPARHPRACRRDDTPDRWLGASSAKRSDSVRLFVMKPPSPRGASFVFSDRIAAPARHIPPGVHPRTTTAPHDGNSPVPRYFPHEVNHDEKGPAHAM
jgi:hypothetical protein